MFKHLLVPLDGTVKAEAALCAALALARGTGARLTLLHVIEKAAPGEVHGEPHLRTREEAEKYLERVAAERIPPEIGVSVHVHEESSDDVGGSLAEHTGELAPDLVVMCVHGGPRLRDMLSGNLAQQTLARGQSPVLLVKSCAGVAEGFRRVLCPLDGNPEHDERGLPAALGMAGISGADLRLLYVVQAGNLMLPTTARELEEIEEQEASEYLQDRLGEALKQGLEARGAVARGEPVERIAAYAADEAADLVVLATHGRAGTRAFWSASVAARLIQRLDVTFLLVPAGK